MDNISLRKGALVGELSYLLPLLLEDMPRSRRLFQPRIVLLNFSKNLFFLPMIIGDRMGGPNCPFEERSWTLLLKALNNTLQTNLQVLLGRESVFIYCFELANRSLISVFFLISLCIAILRDQICTSRGSNCSRGFVEASGGATRRCMITWWVNFFDMIFSIQHM